jgi:hypothetical protein
VDAERARAVLSAPRAADELFAQRPSVDRGLSLLSRPLAVGWSFQPGDLVVARPLELEALDVHALLSPRAHISFAMRI